MRQFTYLLSAAMCAALMGCGSFRGAGDFKTGADFPLPADTRQPANVAGPVERQLGFHWPVSRVRITQGFEPASNPRHKGIDIGGYRGMPIMASKDGRVIYTGHGFHGYGNMVLIEHDDHLATLYAHLQKIKIRKGANVQAGTLVGLMGKTGHATGVHLHFEVMRDRQPMDPLLFMNEQQFVSYK